MKAHSRSSGFSLTEILVVAPIVILVIATFVVFIVTITGEVIKTKASIDTLDDTQTALNYIKADVRLSTSFVSTTGTVASPQGLNDDTTAWTNSGSSTNTLILTRLATDINPINPNSGIVYTNAPYSCSAGKEQNPPFTYHSVYFLKTVGGVQSLWQRNIMKGYPTIINNNVCVTPWQLPTCTPTLVGTQTVCVSADTEVARNVQTFTTEYYNSVGSLTTSRTEATNIKVTLTTNQTIAGQAQTSSDELRVAKRGSEVPAAAYITESVSWTPCAMQNGWTTYTGYQAVGVTKTSTGAVLMSGFFYKQGTRTAGEVMCTLPAGYRPSKNYYFQLPGAGTKAAAIDVEPDGEVRWYDGETYGTQETWVGATGISFLESGAGHTWTNLSSSTSWVSYDGGTTYAAPSVTKDSSGRAWIRGMAKNGSTVINSNSYALPSGYTLPGGECRLYPAANYNAANNDAGSMSPVGSNITFRYGSNTYWSLQAMYYPLGTGSWQAASKMYNGWEPYGYCWGNVGYIKNTDGVVSLKGLIKNGSTSSGASIFDLPVGYRPVRDDVWCAVKTGNGTNDGHAVIGINPDGEVEVAEGVYAAWLSLDGCDFVAEQ